MEHSIHDLANSIKFKLMLKLIYINKALANLSTCPKFNITFGAIQLIIVGITVGNNKCQ